MKAVRILPFFIVVICILVLLASGTNKSRFFMNHSAGGTEPGSMPPVATFSIVAFDPNTKELGIAVQSKVVSVGSIVPWAKGGVGAIATQSYANTQYGPEGLKLLEQGFDPNEVIQKLTAADSGAPSRQVGIVDAAGRVATFTGEKCNGWAGGRTGKFYTVQGNILAGQGVVDGMAEAFEKAKGELGSRLISALEAGQAAGGDKRGRQSAALLIVHEGWGYAGFNDRYRDLRVDDHPEPIQELWRIYDIHKQVFPQPGARNEKD